MALRRSFRLLLTLATLMLLRGRLSYSQQLKYYHSGRKRAGQQVSLHGKHLLFQGHRVPRCLGQGCICLLCKQRLLPSCGIVGVVRKPLRVHGLHGIEHFAGARHRFHGPQDVLQAWQEL